MFNAKDIRSIYEVYGSSKTLLRESISTEYQHDLEDIGVSIVKNDQGENDGDRYYPTWEIRSLANDRVIDWDYASGGETIQDVATRIMNVYKKTGRPTFA